MNKRVFYDHLVVIEEITAELDKHDLDSDERENLVRLVDENLHNEVINLILSHLPQEKHQDFLSEFHASPHDERLLAYLKGEIGEEIEEKIKEEAKRVKQEILAEVKRAKKK